MAENLGVKNSQWDKNDGLIVKRDCYNSYFYPVESDKLEILDRLYLHGKPRSSHCVLMMDTERGNVIAITMHRTKLYPIQLLFSDSFLE